MRITPLGLNIRLAAADKEAAKFSSVKVLLQAFEVEEAAIHYVESARLGQQPLIIGNVDLVRHALADMEKSRDVAMQVEQGVPFDRRLGRAKGHPRKHP